MRLTYTITDYAEVRLLVDPQLTALELSDAVIESGVYLGTAEDWAYSENPTAFDLIGDDLVTLKRSIFHMAAARILENSSNVISGSMHEQSFTTDPGDHARRISLLKRAAIRLLGQLESVPVPVERKFPVQFGLAHARRRRW